MTARARHLRSTTETERTPTQGADDVLKLLQPTLCLDSRQLTASLRLTSTYYDHGQAWVQLTSLLHPTSLSDNLSTT